MDTKTKIKIIVNNKEQEIDIDLNILIKKAQERSLSNDEIQRILIYLLTKK
jgi:hypothetical protein